ncbi:MAG TPA: transcription antitermination factor NusB [Armatimonadota bacterium]|nr:transcription antitermination factor NusB [Armatimonadota bacterium]
MTTEERPRKPRKSGARRRARELALAALYRADLLDLRASAAISAIQDILALAIEEWPEKDRHVDHIREEALEYAVRIINGVCTDRDGIDEIINRIATHWPVGRQSVTDRTILRIALWELSLDEHAPAVIVNEAVEVAGDFGGPESSKFVNGILGAKLKEEPAEPVPDEAPQQEQ